MAVKNPITGGEMRAEPLPSKERLIKSMVERGSNIIYATNKAEQMLEKEQQLGVLYVDPITRYRMRVKSEGKGKKESSE